MVYSARGALLTLTEDILRQWRDYLMYLYSPTDTFSVEGKESGDKGEIYLSPEVRSQR